VSGARNECRLNAGCAAQELAPAPGRITTYREHAGPGVGSDSGARDGSRCAHVRPDVAQADVWTLDR